MQFQSFPHKMIDVVEGLRSTEEPIGNIKVSELYYCDYSEESKFPEVQSKNFKYNFIHYRYAV